MRIAYYVKVKKPSHEVSVSYKALKTLQKPGTVPFNLAR